MLRQLVVGLHGPRLPGGLMPLLPSRVPCLQRHALQRVAPLKLDRCIAKTKSFAPKSLPLGNRLLETPQLESPLLESLLPVNSPSWSFTSVSSAFESSIPMSL